MPQLIERGHPITLDLDVLDTNGDLTDPDEDPTIDVIDAAGATIVLDDTPTHASLGRYTYTYEVDADALLGAWEIRWAGIIGGQPITTTEGFTVVPAGALSPLDAEGLLATIEDLATFIRLPIDTIDQDAAAAALRGASNLVRQELGQHIDYVADDVVTLKSPGGKLLLLPELPVIDVTLVRWRRPGGDYVTLVEGTDYEVELGRAGKIWRIGSAALGFFGESSSEWPRAIGRGLSGFIEVTYSHGYDITGGADYSDADPVPELMSTVVNRVAARGYQNPEAVSQETTGRGAVVYSNPGLYLSNDDKRDLDHFRPGGAGGSR